MDGRFIKKNPVEISASCPLVMKVEFQCEYWNRSFAIKAHVRQVVDMVSSTDVAADGDGWPIGG